MGFISGAEWAALLEKPAGPAVSLYLPTHRAFDTEQDVVRLKNLLRAAEEKLVSAGMRVPLARDLVEPGRRMLAQYDFWGHRGEGLALFMSTGMFLHYHLPQSFPELVVVSESFHIRPLLPLLVEDGLFYVLGISQDKMRLLECTRYEWRDATPAGVPSSLAETLKYDEQEKLQVFHGVPGGPGSAQHTAGGDFEKKNILRYFQQVNERLVKALAGQKAPLVLAAVAYLHPIYREANGYAGLLPRGVEGNPDLLSEAQLHQRGREAVEPFFEDIRHKALERYGHATGAGLALARLSDVVLAACNGRVDTLFVADGAHAWGVYSAARHEVLVLDKEEPGSQDLLDLAAGCALTGGGTVYALDPALVPGAGMAAALLRY